MDECLLLSFLFSFFFFFFFLHLSSRLGTFSKNIDIFLISPGKQVLWVFVRSASPGSTEFPQRMLCVEKQENISVYPSYLELCFYAG